MPYLRDNMHRQNARNNVEVIIQTPTRLMFSDKFSNDIKKLYNGTVASLIYFTLFAIFGINFNYF